MILFHVAVVQCPNYIPWFLWISFDFWAAIRIGIPARCRRSSLGGNRSDDNIVERLSIFFFVSVGCCCRFGARTFQSCVSFLLSISRCPAKASCRIEKKRATDKERRRNERTHTAVAIVLLTVVFAAGAEARACSIK